MSLIKCPDCGHEVSDQATACVYCGFPIARLRSAAIRSDPNHPVCPKCGGTYTGRISLAYKVAAHRAIGNGRKTFAGKEYQCLQCKHKW